MPFSATIPVMFPCDKAIVYRALCDLSSYPLWTSGLVHISHTGPMYEGLRYETEAAVAGHMNRAVNEVVHLVENEEIELLSNTGSITYHAIYRLTSSDPGQTRVVCILKFQFRSFVLNLAKSAVEGMARARTRGDLEALRAIICDETPEPAR